MAEKHKGCVASAAGPIVESKQKKVPAEVQEEVAVMGVTVGMKAPDFEATAYADGDFKNIKLSDYAGQWGTLCFYPGDFTFV